MKTLPSAEFRKSFHKLTEPVVVTVLGHPIGTWVPGVGMPEHDVAWAGARSEREAFAKQLDERMGRVMSDTFGAPKAAPKPGKKR